MLKVNIFFGSTIIPRFWPQKIKEIWVDYFRKIFSKIFKNFFSDLFAFKIIWNWWRFFQDFSCTKDETFTGQQVVDEWMVHAQINQLESLSIQQILADNNLQKSAYLSTRTKVRKSSILIDRKSRTTIGGGIITQTLQTY